MNKAPSNLNEFDLSKTAFAFRGFNITNLGSSHRLLAQPDFAPIVSSKLKQASEICSEYLHRPVDLIARIKSQTETKLSEYAEAIAMIVGMELAQIELLKTFYGIDFSKAKFAFGYSLGEISALVAANVISLEDALRVPVSLAKDCASMAKDVTLAVIFCKRAELTPEQVHLACIQVNESGTGVIGVSAYLAPNSFLVMGQNGTVDRLRKVLKEEIRKQGPEAKLLVRKNSHEWPPMHTPIVWQQNIPSRAAIMMHQMKVHGSPKPSIFSLVSGKANYSPPTTRDILYRWTDQPQRIWDAVCHTFNEGINTIIHVGPEPNIIPATFHRLSENVRAQIESSMGAKAISGIANRPWLAGLLSERALMSRAPSIKHVILEDWLLECSQTAVASELLN